MSGRSGSCLPQVALVAAIGLFPIACKGNRVSRETTTAVAEPARSAEDPPQSAVGPAENAPAPSGAAPENDSVVAATVIAATVYKLPDIGSRRLGYIRIGQKVRREPEPVDGKGCKGDWYRVLPTGYVCTDEVTTDPTLPLVRAASKGPDLTKPMPYRYGFVRATSPQYLRVPTADEQHKSELALDEHLRWYQENRLEVQRVELGANDVPIDGKGFPVVGGLLPPGQKLSSVLDMNEVFNGARGERIPFWLEGGRKIPNVSGFDVPEYAVFADRVRRKTGLSFVDAFVAKDGDFERRFGVTVDLRLIPLTKVKPDSASMFHGVEVGANLSMPFAFVNRRGATTWKLIKGSDQSKAAEAVPLRAIVPLSGNARIKGGTRYYQTRGEATRWLAADDLGVVTEPPSWPEAANKGQRWIDVSLVQQTLVMYEGRRPVYATLVSSGQDRLGDPKTSKATPRGEFKIRSKHVSAAMDSEENSQIFGGTREGPPVKLGADVGTTIERLKAAEKAGAHLDEDDSRRLENIKKGRHPEYGITMRRGSQNYELRDVPWIQYFASGYALHGAYWHDVFGIPRSHGCINLSPIDAHLLFLWTEPAVPAGWQGVNAGAETGEGTTVVVRE